MKNKFGLFDNDLETIVSVLSQYNKVDKAYIFGSRAKGNFKNGSDIDIALKGTELDFRIPTFYRTKKLSHISPINLNFNHEKKHKKSITAKSINIL